MNRIETFEYLPGGAEQASSIWNGYEDPEGGARSEADSAGDPANRDSWEKRLAEEARKAFEAGRERGREEAREAGREAAANARAQEEHRMTSLIENFAEARDRYLRAVESEVVKLALAIASRILRREAQMDPLLLTGAVRVALGQLSSTTEVTLRVPAGDLDLWREAIAHIPNLAVKPEVMAGEGLRLGECIVESKVGIVDLGIRSQLGEIERGFFDRGENGTQSKPAREQLALEEARR